MKKFVIVLTGLVVALSLLGVSANLKAAEPNKPKMPPKTRDTTIIGTVNVTKDGSGNVTDVKIKTAKLDTYSVTLNDKAKELAKSMEGKNVRATGVVETKNGAKWLTVEKFEEVTAKAPVKRQPKAHEPNKPK
jgi:hypothetical protein